MFLHLIPAVKFPISNSHMTDMKATTKTGNSGLPFYMKQTQ
jgi:hypothetical protein